MTKNTLYISFDGLSDPLGQSQILPYICGLAGNGFHITVLSCEKKRLLVLEESGIRKLLEGLPIDWHYIIYNEDGGLLSRWFYIQKLRALALRVHKERTLSLVHCRSYLASLIGLRFKRKYKIPFVFDMRGLWADERMDGNIWSKKNKVHQVLYSYFKKKEKQFLVHADAIVSLTQAGLDELCRLYPEELIRPKTKIIPCCTNTALFDPKITLPAYLPGIGQNDHVIIYTGSIGTWYYTKEMIDCILVWKTRIPNIKLLVLTKDTETLDQILDSYSPEQRHCVIVSSASYSEVPAFLKLAKAALFFIKPAYSKVASSPTKMAECWAMNLPIITNSGIGDNDLYFRTHQGGVLLEEFSRREYLKACEKYLSLPANDTHYRQIALNHFDTRQAVTSYTSLYHAIVKP
ncbi:MAG: glycosyltransferase [bacterium]|nr:glycosyltransferase [bacterium]